VRARARNDANLNETLSAIFADIEGSATGSASEDDFKGLFDDLDVNSGKLCSAPASILRPISFRITIKTCRSA
jgi:type I restriction-modification system DNA methylase subunit